VGASSDRVWSLGHWKPSELHKEVMEREFRGFTEPKLRSVGDYVLDLQVWNPQDCIDHIDNPSVLRWHRDGDWRSHRPWWWLTTGHHCPLVHPDTRYCVFWSTTHPTEVREMPFAGGEIMRPVLPFEVIVFNNRRFEHRATYRDDAVGVSRWFVRGALLDEPRDYGD
jgi:hypothetical protein